MENRLGNFIGLYLEHLRQNYKTWNYSSMSSTIDKEILDNSIKEFNDTLRVEEGQKYFKVIRDNSVHCFIDKDGFIWKPASWKGPTKNFHRGNVNEPESYKNHRWNGV
jgi:hypothetical protein